MSLWLTQVLLTKALLEGRADDGRPVYEKFVDDYRIHRTSWEFFPGREDKARDFLTRIQRSASGGRFLILSQEKPVRPDWCGERFFATKPVSEGFLAHPCYRFNLLANPTRKRRTKDSNDIRTKNGARKAWMSEGALRLWLERKGMQHGFRVVEETLRTEAPETRTFRKPGARGKHVAVEFSGVLTVTDRELFVQAVARGIGTAKGFGFGMLLLAPCKL